MFIRTICGIIVKLELRYISLLENNYIMLSKFIFIIPQQSDRCTKAEKGLEDHPHVYRAGFRIFHTHDASHYVPCGVFLSNDLRFADVYGES